MTRHVSPALIGAATLLVASGSLAFAFTAQRHVPGRSYTDVAVAFDQLGPALRVGNDVRVRGVRVGQVKTIGFAHGKPLVVLQLDGDRRVYRDAMAVIASRSALGQKYVSLEPGHPTSGLLPAGTALSPGAAGNAVDLDALLSVFDPATRKALGSAVRDIGNGAAGHSQDINDALGNAPALLDDGAKVSTALTDPAAHLAEVLADARQLSARLTGNRTQIADAIGQSGTTLQALGVDGGAPLKATLAELPHTLTNAQVAMTSLSAPLSDLRVGLTDLQPGAGAIGAGTEQIRATMRGYVDPLNSLTALSPQLDRSVVTLNGLMVDARPFAPKLHRAFALASTPLAVLAPYSPEVALWFMYAKSALAGHDNNGHWLRFDILGNSETLSGSGPLGTMAKDPMTSRDPYPAPGVAQRQTAQVGAP